LPSSYELREALLHAVDEALLVPGEIVRTTIYERIETTYEIKRQGIPEKLEAFDSALRELLGAGSPVMERLIAKNLFSRLGLNFTRHDGWTLVDYVNHAKRAKRNG
jgi:hypothetical protein